MSEPLVMSFPLRSDFTAQFVLPRDLTMAEAARLAVFMETLTEPSASLTTEWVCAAWAREHTAELRASASVDTPALREIVKEMREDARSRPFFDANVDRWANQIEKALKGRKSE